MNKLLDQLVSEMVAKGVHYDDAHREFDKRFVAHVIERSEGNLCRAAEILGMHRNTLSRKIARLKIRTPR